MSKHIGVVGEKLSAEVVITSIFEYKDFSFGYGGTTKYIYTMKDAEGNVIVWKTTCTANVALNKEGTEWHFFRKGDEIRVKGRIKEHGEYKGTEQTILTRCKFELIKAAPTKEEIEEQQRNEQLASLAEGDRVWKMPYKQYKEHYADCETIKGSYKFDECMGNSIEVIIRAGRLKNSGVRGEHFYGFQFKSDEGKLVCYRAVNEENARKQMKKDFPESAEWECTKIFRHSTREFW